MLPGLTRLTIVLARSSSLSKQRSARAHCQPPAAAFRYSLHLCRLSMTYWKLLQLIWVKLCGCTHHELERCCSGDRQEHKDVWVSCKLLHMPHLPQSSLTIPLFSYRSRKLLMHACSVSFWTLFHMSVEILKHSVYDIAVAMYRY